MSNARKLNFTDERFDEIFSDFLYLKADREYKFYRTMNCEGISDVVPYILIPHNHAEVIKIVKLCNKYSIGLYPVSSGQNWGYGSGRSIRSSDIVLDLSKLKKIFHLDEELGVVEIEAGVTIQELYLYLNERNSKWMTPVTGAGPNGSIIANALEKGFGLNPITDHFLSLVSLKVLLPNGEIYESRLKNIGATKSDQVSKWKVGPYFEGLFAQSSFGLILSAQVELAIKPNKVNLLILKAKKENLETLIKTIQHLKTQFPCTVGAVNISNKQRLEFTIDQKEINRISFIKKIEQAMGLGFEEYTAVVPLFEHHRSYLKIHKAIRKEAKKFSLSSQLFTENNFNFLKSFKHIFRHKIFAPVWIRFDEGLNFLNLMKGIPSNFTLKIAYSEPYSQNKTNNPAIDQVGLFWFAPIIRLIPEDFTVINEICERVLPKHGQRNLLTFTILNSKLVEATIPIYYDPKDNSEQAIKKSLACWDELFTECLKQNFAPYRYSVLHMDRITPKDEATKKLLKIIKQHVDPNEILMKGRYE